MKEWWGRVYISLFFVALYLLLSDWVCGGVNNNNNNICLFVESDNDKWLVIAGFLEIQEKKNSKIKTGLQYKCNDNQSNNSDIIYSNKDPKNSRSMMKNYNPNK